MKRKMTITLMLVASLLSVQAQQVWTLQQCISHAIAHNISVQQQQDNVQQQEIALNTARFSRLPDLSASAGENFSFGRGLTSDNTYANRNTQSTSFSLGTNVPLITGGRYQRRCGSNAWGCRRLCRTVSRRRTM